MAKYVTSLIDEIKKSNGRYKPFIKFFLRAILLGGAWIIFYKIFRYQPFIDTIYDSATHTLTNILLEISRLSLELFNYQAIIDGKILRIAGDGGILLDRGCLARNLLGLYAGFILVYPGNWKPKLWFIPLGLISIFFINIMRIAALTYISYKFPQYLDINHNIIFKYTAYGATFALWYIYINYLSRETKK